MTVYKIRLALEWDDASKAYAVSSPDVPGLNTFGADMAEVRANVVDALETLVDYLQQEGLDLPPALQQPVSGQIETDLLLSLDPGVKVKA